MWFGAAEDEPLVVLDDMEPSFGVTGPTQRGGRTGLVGDNFKRPPSIGNNLAGLGQDQLGRVLMRAQTSVVHPTHYGEHSNFRWTSFELDESEESPSVNQILQLQDNVTNSNPGEDAISRVNSKNDLVSLGMHGGIEETTRASRGSLAGLARSKQHPSMDDMAVIIPANKWTPRKRPRKSFPYPLPAAAPIRNPDHPSSYPNVRPHGLLGNEDG